ncbi:MAG: hypothetical protein C4344_06760, partial [Acidimicrobiia bacterium]
MTIVLLLLAGVWGVVIYTYVKDRMAEPRPADSIGSFRRQLHVLERTAPHARRPQVPVSVRRPGSAARKRRRDILCWLAASMAGSLLLSLLPGLGVMLVLHVVLDVAFVAYVALLVRFRNLRAEQAAKVRRLPQAGPLPGAPEPALLL